MRTRALFAGLFVMLCASSANADDADDPKATDPGRWSRPIKYASVEYNPLANLVWRRSGQVTVGLAGPVAIVGGVGYLDIKGSQGYDSYDDRMEGDPRVHGWTFELGPRFFVRLKHGRAGRLDLWLGPSLLYDRLRQEEVRGCSSSSDCRTLEPATDKHRFGIAHDIGIQFTSSIGLYALVGPGFHWVQSKSFSTRSNGDWDFGIDDIQKGTTWFRLNAAIGFGF